MGNLIKPVIVLFLIALAAAGALAFTFTNTNPLIQELNLQKQNAGLKAIFEDADSFKESDIDGTKYFTAENSSGNVLGYVFSLTEPGYSSDGVQMLVGVNTSKEIQGIQIIKQTETPGLGTEITKPWFLDQFKGKKASDDLKPKKDIDAITGATISSKAVASGARNALEKAEKVSSK